MQATQRYQLATIVLATTCALAASADLVWFDPTANGNRHDSFGDLSSSYQAFTDSHDQRIGFDDLKQGKHLSNQYAGSHGVTFDNSWHKNHKRSSGVRDEGGRIAEHITGYDGTFRPHGDNVYVKFENDHADNKFMFTFDTPVASVGSFVGMGVQGNMHDLQIELFDIHNELIDSVTHTSWLWEANSKKQNYESFWAVEADEPMIASVSILNLATKNYANALILDELTWSHTPVDRGAVPEPLSGTLLAAGGLWLLWQRRR